MREKEFKFWFYLKEKYATDETFQQINRPRGNVLKKKKYCSGINHLYGCKEKFPFYEMELILNAANLFLVLKLISQFSKKRIQWHCVSTEKVEAKASKLNDDGEISGKIQINYLAILEDKGYHGFQDQIRTFVNKKKSINGFLTDADKIQHKAIPYNRKFEKKYFWSFVHVWFIFP